MVNIFVKNKDILCDFKGTDAFADIVAILKSHHCRFNPDKKVWKISVPKLDKVLEDLKDLEVVSISAADLEAIEDIKRGDPELKISEERLVFHPELLRFPPFKGKPPNEDFQKQDILRAINRNRYGMFLDMGLGKAVSMDTWVQTLSGPVQMKDIRVGDKLLTTYGKSSDVVAIYPQGIKPLVTLYLNDGSSCKVSLDHLWSVRVQEKQNKNHDIITLSTQQIIDGITHQKTLKGINASYSKYFLPEILPVEYPAAPLELPPYFLGALIGDGCLRGSVSLIINEDDVEIVNRCEKDLTEFGEVFKISVFNSKSKAKTYSFVMNQNYSGWRPNTIINKLKILKLYGKKSPEKQIPSTYLYNSVVNRLALLQGLMDTDGYISKNGDILQFSNSNELLISQIKLLVESLGGRGTVARKKTKNLDHFCLTFKLPKDICPFYLSRKKTRYLYNLKNRKTPFRSIVSWEKAEDGECQCIKVNAADSLFLINNFIPTHNTYEAAAIIAHLRYYNKANKVLFVSSNIGAANVVHEFLKFMYISPDEILCMTRVGKDRELFKQDKSIIITNYNTFRVVCEYYYKKTHKKAAKVPKRIGAPVLPIEWWLGGKPGILMLDESHALGDPDSQQTSRVLLHAPAFEYRYLFTGTPADKNEKLYAQLKVLDSALVHNYSYCEWKEEYNNLGNKFSAYAINPEGWKYDKLQKLNQLVVQKYGVYRNAEDHLELPENRIKKLYLTMEQNHKEIYQSFIKKTLEDIRTARGSLFTRDIVNSFPYMQMALDNPKNIVEMHPDLLSPELTKAIRSFSMEKDHAKIAVVSDILAERFDTNPKDKGIIWIWHPATAKLLAEMFKKYHPLFIIGETDDRMSLVDKFKNEEEHRILIASIPVLNTSITITEASFQVYLERTYNYSQYIQSMARIHRIGQKKTTVTYVPLFDYTIDVLLDKNLENKDLLNTKLLSKDFLSLKEWSEIFNMTETTEFNW